MKIIFEEDKKYIANTYNRYKVAIKKSKGATCFDYLGKKYIDFSSGIAVNTFGGQNKKIIKGIKKQLKLLAHSSNLYYTVPQVQLAKTLCQKTGAQKVFFSNSGAEANECAIKCARKYSFDKYGANRYEIITLTNSFHGRTMATLTATGQNAMHASFFEPYLDGFKYINAGDIDGLKKAVNKKTAAIMVELIQGESGVNPLSYNFVQELVQITAKNDILLIVDEVQTGNGRTGLLYEFTRFNIKPDIVTTAKGLAGGLPIGATMFFDKTANVLSFTHHGSTFGGNPISCASAVCVLEQLDDDFLQTVEQKGEYLTKKLLEIDGVKGVSGKGLMIGVEVEDAANIAAKCVDAKLLILTAKDKLRILPPLNITYKELDLGLEILREVIKNETFA